jgi:hypothetical protein
VNPLKSFFLFAFAGPVMVIGVCLGIRGYSVEGALFCAGALVMAALSGRS